MKIVIAPDSFKGTLSAAEVADGLRTHLSARFPDAEIVAMPVADGGEGLVECLERTAGARRVSCRVTGPLFEKVDARFLLTDDFAVVETAQAAGLPMVDPPQVMRTTTLGVGEMIVLAEQLGAKQVLLGLGGSATNDMGCGMAAALGCRFWNGTDYFVPVGGTLGDVQRIEYGPRHNIVALCDVKSPLYGPQGAAYVYGPQKGATAADVVALDQGLRHVAQLLQADGKQGFDVEGAGAAGGLGAGVIAFAGGKLRRGIDAVLDALHFDETVAAADLVITGEGRLDTQSFAGKVIDGILARCKCPVVAVVGQQAAGPNYAQWGLSAVFATADHLPAGADYRKEAHRTLLAAADVLADWIDANVAE